MAIKEEQYDPGYEDAYAGTYAEGGAKEGQSQVNGQCTFSSGEPSGNVEEYICQPLSETLYSTVAMPPITHTGTTNPTMPLHTVCKDTAKKRSLIDTGGGRMSCL